jgi:large subunit ribosomal protein L29
MKANEIRDMTLEEIRQRIDENESTLQALRFQHAVAQLEDPMVLRRTRREIARLQTILKEKEKTGEVE